jgi:hypothetical protein
MVASIHPIGMKTGTILVAVVTLLATLTEARATTYFLQPVADARVIDLPGYQNLNFASDILSCYTEAPNDNTQRTFIQFDLSSLALASTQIVQSATLTLTASTAFGTNNGFQPMEIYRVLAPWTETGLTWSNRDTAVPWATPGGDFIGTGGQPYAVSTASPTNGGTVTWDITALVQEWVGHVSTNYGLMLKSESGNHLTFNQREAGAGRPALTVVVGFGLPPVHAYASGGEVVLWWPGTNIVLQEKTNLDPTVIWSDSTRSVVQSSGSNSVTIPSPKGVNFFRLRAGP